MKERFLRKTGWLLLCLFCILCQPDSILLAQNPAGDLDQVRNGSAAMPNDPGQWVNGNAGASNAHYLEGYSIPYRLKLTNLVVGVSYNVKIEWDITHSGKHAIDYITSFNRINDPSHNAAFGHTPGHTAFAVHSRNQSMLAMSDTVRNPYLFARHPDWQPAFDMDGLQAVEARRRMLDRVAADRMLIEAYHFPFPACGHIAKTASGYEFVPIEWKPL